MEAGFAAPTYAIERAILTLDSRTSSTDGMAAQATLSNRLRRSARGFTVLPLSFLIVPLIAAGCFVAYVLWPSWPGVPFASDAPALPITVAGALFEIPAAAIRAAVQRHPGPHERIDLAFEWPSLTPPQSDSKVDEPPLAGAETNGTAAPNPKTEMADAAGRLFVTIAGMGSLLPPAERLRSIYPHYVEAQARAGRDGLAILPFRSGTPYEGEDLIYVADQPDRFYARCSHRSDAMPGTCIHERLVGAADVTLRFPRDWAENDWRSVATGFDRLIAQLHPPGS
jgi:hypothetical protein